MQLAFNARGERLTPRGEQPPEEIVEKFNPARLVSGQAIRSAFFMFCVEAQMVKLAGSDMP